jgi:hypothetical protein
MFGALARACRLFIIAQLQFFIIYLHPWKPTECSGPRPELANRAAGFDAKLNFGR